VRGPTGSVLYQSDLSTNGTFPTIKGTTGVWQIQFSFEKTDGNITLRIVKAP
jgi:hypothetical protein